MRILLVHNFYQQPGGEDLVFEAEGQLLEDQGHLVERFTLHNDDVAALSPLALSKATVWNSGVYDRLRLLLRRMQPDVVHFHNTLPLISPAAYHAVRKEGIPVVQTLHNYRLLCPGVYFLREGKICEDCLGRRTAWPGVVHGCYRRSRAATGAVALMLSVHHALRTWTEQITLYIAMTDFVRDKFIQGGIPPEKIVVKAHFVSPSPEVGSGGGGYALYVGRLSPEKGIRMLLATWEQFAPSLPLVIAGEGPLQNEVRAAAARTPSIRWLGHQPPQKVTALMQEAAVVVVPSESYETFGRVVAESFAVGTPVAASRIGAIAELVEHGRTGRLFQPGLPADLAAQLAWFDAHPEARAALRREARAEYESKYTAARNYELLMQIYAQAGRASRPA